MFMKSLGAAAIAALAIGTAPAASAAVIDYGYNGTLIVSSGAPGSPFTANVTFSAKGTDSDLSDNTITLTDVTATTDLPGFASLSFPDITASFSGGLVTFDQPDGMGGSTFLGTFTLDPTLLFATGAAPTTLVSGQQDYTLPGSGFLVGFQGGSGVFTANVEPSGVPEPASWAMMISGFGLVGGALRTRKARPAFA